VPVVVVTIRIRGHIEPLDKIQPVVVARVPSPAVQAIHTMQQVVEDDSRREIA
jgi:hypothetical protein